MGKKKSTSPKSSAPAQRRAPVKAGASARKVGPDTQKKARRSAEESKPTAEPKQNGGRRPESPAAPIVGIGASAGGLEAFAQFLENLPADTGMAFVLIQHLDPKHESMLTELLSRASRMPVMQVTQGMPVEPNHVYVIPPNKTMRLCKGILELQPRQLVHGQAMPIDEFFRSLAVEQKSKAIGVILSGTASDGALGLEAIKAEGGITFAQNEKSAKYAGMPRAAIATGCVDFTLPPQEIARELTRIARHPYVTRPEAEHETKLIKNEDGYNRVINTLNSTTGVNFAYYKNSTIQRRIIRRMALQRIEKLEDYIEYLQNTPAEVEALYQDVLIKVTGFFRDPDTFEILKNTIFSKLLKNRPPNIPVRLWVPGCATGEEAYSLAICLVEFLGDMIGTTPIQIFATDISESALEKARSGIYLENIALDVSPERLRRFFVKTHGGYQINKSIRNLCIFARQNVAQDPPFSNLDLISCRNLLIYLGPILQKKVIPCFHYALKPAGFLMLGNSEALGSFTDLFTLIDKRHKIYTKKATLHRVNFDFSSHDPMAGSQKTDFGKRPTEEAWSGIDVQKEADRIVLNRYAPCGVVVNDDMEILQFRGHTSPYLEPAPGKASLNLLKMAREGLLVKLRAAIHKVKKTGAPARENGVQIKYDDHVGTINLEVIPLTSVPSARGQHFLILFQEASPSSAAEKKGAGNLSEKARQKAIDYQSNQLKQELAATKEYLQSIIEEQEATNEELKSANEEILSSNEELQSTNEEMETAKEELQSANEELTTVNEELQNRNQELSLSNNDLSNLLSSVGIPIVMLGADLRIRRFTSMAERVLNLIPTDIGRPISDIKPNINIPDLEALILDVIDSMSIKEQEVQDREGHWYFLRIRPYRALDNKIDGVVMALVDIDAVKRGLEQEKEARHKEVLLKEIHHRIKNNLQIISSLLNLQSGQVTDQQTIDRLKESRNRIRAMALIHEVLYQSKELNKVVVNEYIQDLTKNLFHSYGVNTKNIQLKVQADHRLLSTDAALPCGLILNELISNALKHAFLPGRTGEISVGVSTREEDLVLWVRDNGIGFPKDLDFRRTESLGLQLVNTLIDQLGGRIELHTNGGTEFEITFKELTYKEKV